MDKELTVKVQIKWERFVLRMRERRSWHDCGLRLWLLRRPSLRFVPFPYPSVANAHQWKLQAEGMVANGCLIRRHLQRAIAPMASAEHLKEMHWFRDRVGWQLAFLEDPVLQGMMAARVQKGVRSQIRQAAIKEAQQEAAEAEKKGEKVMAMRELIGPRGGLPTLRKDVLRLAALLHVKVGEKESVEAIKQRLKPIVNSMLEDIKKAPPSKASSSAEPMMQAPTVLPVASRSSESAPTPKSWEEVRSPTVNEGIGNLFLLQVKDMLYQQEERYQTMYNQVLHHMMQMVPNPTPLPEDELMTDATQLQHLQALQQSVSQANLQGQIPQEEL